MSDSFGGFDIGSIVGHLTLDKKDWASGITGARQDLSGLGANFKKLGQEALDVGKKILAIGAVGTVAAAAGLAKIITSTANAGDEINDLAQRTGIATEILSSYKLAAQKCGSSIEGFAVGMRGLASNMQAGVEAGTAQAEMFDALGVQIVDNEGKLQPLNDVMLDVADRFKEMEDGAEKTALAQDIFGRSGMDLIPFLNLGAAGLREEATAAARLGLVFTKDAAAACDVFNDALAELKGATAGVRNEIGIALIPVVRQLVEGVTSGLGVLRTEIAKFAASGQLREWAVAAAGGFVSAFKIMAMAVEGLILILPSLKAAIFSVDEVFYKSLGKIAEGISNIPGVGAQASVALKVWASDFKALADTFSNAADANIEKASSIVAGFEALYGTLDKVKAAFRAVSAAGSSTTTITATALPPAKALADAYGEVTTTIVEGILPAARQIPDAILAFANPVAEVSGVLDVFITDFENGLTSIMDGTKSIGAAFSSIVNSMIKELGNLVIQELGGVRKIIEALKFKTIAHYIASAFKKFGIFAVPVAALGFGIVSKLFSKLLKFEQGGVFNKPTIAEVGHGTEYVLPEKKLINIVRDALAGGRGSGGPMSPQLALAGAGVAAGGHTVAIHQTVNVQRLDRQTVREASDLIWEQVEWQAQKRGMKLLQK